VLSTETKPEIRKTAMNSGVSIWIQKPFNTDKLIEYIKRALLQNSTY
jgi:DNA-binding response OmpR family regulator